MKLLHLDFERPERARGPAWSLLAVGVGVALFVLGQYQAVSKESARYQEQLKAQQARIKAATPVRAVDPREIKLLEDHLSGAGGVLEQLNVPWDRLFGALDRIDEPEVAILQLSPELEKKQIRMLAEAKNVAAMLRYHQALEKSGAFVDVALADHEIQQQDPDRPIRFNLIATWVLANARQ